MKLVATLVAVACLTGACGSGGGDSSATAPAVASDGGSRSIDELIGLLKGVGCPLEEVTPTEGYDISRQAACPDAELQVYTFTSTTSRDQVVDGILAIAGEFAVVGTNWVAEVRSRGMADKVNTALAGTVRTAKPSS